MSAHTTITERPPVIVVMGHVDHGKSSLLDYIRKSNIVAGEAGGITQHVAAYEVEHTSTEHGTKRITFIDTPGHAAFSSIRARGASLADIAILVVSAEEGVKEQTLEALRHIQESKIPFFVAINKIDKPGADIERTKSSLLEKGVYLEGFGGTTAWVAVSAKVGTGIPELLDTVLLMASLEEYKGDTAQLATGFVLEAHRDTKRGIAATLIITNGTLKTGEVVLSGSTYAPLRILEDHMGKSLKTAHFSTPITVIGFDALPEVGATFTTFINKKAAEVARTAHLAAAALQAERLTAEIPGKIQVPVIIKADTTGSLEAIELVLGNIATEKAYVRVVGKGIGMVTDTDIKAAGVGGARLIAFNIPTDSNARELARNKEISVESFDIIYRITEYMEGVLATATPKEKYDEVLGKAHVLKLFSEGKGIYVLGGRMFEGFLRLDKQVKVMRRNVQVGTGLLINLQQAKANVNKVDTGEFGMQIESKIEIVPNDVLECFITVEK
jgi:translation initiation factor IF-2